MRTTRTSRGPGPEGPDYGHDSFVDADNFARAVDHGLRRTSDPTLNRELALVAALRDAGTRVGPDSSERDRMRQRIMAEFPSVVHGGSNPVLPLRTSGRRRHAAPVEARGRLVVVAAAALCLFMSLSGMSLLLSRDALPGDTLYTFKRSAETAELGLTFGDERKALKHLEFADARVSELEVLTDQADAAGTWSAGQDKFVRALDDFELDTTAATRLLTTVAAGGQTGVLSSLRGWAKQQETRLEAVRGALPLAVSAQLNSTLELLDRVIARVAALDQRSDCRTITSGTHDDLGLLPARGACEQSVVSSQGKSSAAQPPEGEAALPGAGPAGSLLPPGLLTPPSDLSTPIPGQLGLPPAAGDVLPIPGESDSDPAQPESGDGGPEPPELSVPLPPGGIPLLPLIPLEDPHVE